MTHSQTTCPHCERVNPLASDMEGSDSSPSNGDVSLCWGCGIPAIFAIHPIFGLQARKPTEDEWVVLKKDPRIAQFYDMAQDAKTPTELIHRYQQGQ